jgi:hypothetical protein
MVSHADGFVVDELAVAGDGDGGGGDSELLAELSGDATHLSAMLAGGASVSRLGEGFGDRQGCGGGGESEVLNEVAAGDGALA